MSEELSVPYYFESPTATVIARAVEQEYFGHLVQFPRVIIPLHTSLSRDFYDTDMASRALYSVLESAHTFDERFPRSWIDEIESIWGPWSQLVWDRMAHYNKPTLGMPTVELADIKKKESLLIREERSDGRLCTAVTHLVNANKPYVVPNPYPGFHRDGSVVNYFVGDAFTNPVDLCVGIQWAVAMQQEGLRQKTLN